jgi:hypothetical protein
VTSASSRERQRAGGTPDQLKAAIIEGSHHAFMNGVHTAALVSGVLAVIGALMAAAGVRRAPEAARH